ncbi:SurA N-terminal domain-containing protein [uncultured Roseibium sp.]|uniref:peptidylprolyl isomerase n=1 Tax=uncultured Roseibium sp. TaxID=1936171 RepID=UPI0032179778
MLDALRKGAGTWVAKIFIGLLVLSFAVWGVADVFRGFGQNVAAEVGGTEISLIDFDRAYRRDLSRFSQQLGRQLTTREGAQLGIAQQTLGTLIAEAALNENARTMNLGISDEKLTVQIQQDPSFKSGGSYDPNLLKQILRNNGMSEDDFVTEQRSLAERQQLAQAISGGMVVPTAYLKVLHDYQSETRNVAYVVIEPSHLGEIAEPDADTLMAFFETEKAKFKAPEYRKITLLQLTPDTIARPEDVSDADAQAEYDDNKQQYHDPEKRKVRQLSFTKPEDAKAAADKLAAGMSFDDLMKDLNLTDNDVYLGLMAKGDFLDTAIGDAAFSLDEGATSGIVDGRFSSVILNVLEVQPEKTQPFEAVKDDIKALLAKEQAEREVLDLLGEIEDARAGGATLKEVGERFHLDTTTPDEIDSTGKNQAEAEVELPNAKGLVSGVFDSDVGVENDPLQLGTHGFLWYEVDEVIPSRDRTLDEVKDKVIAAWKEAESEKRLAEKATELAEKAKSGTELAVLAESNGLELKTADGIARNVAAGDISGAAASQAFDGAEGSVFDVEAADKTGRLVIKVTGRNTTEFNEADPTNAALKTQLASQLQDSLLNQYISNIETQAGIQVNQAGIASVLGLGDSN